MSIHFANIYSSNIKKDIKNISKQNLSEQSIRAKKNLKIIIKKKKLLKSNHQRPLSLLTNSKNYYNNMHHYSNSANNNNNYQMRHQQPNYRQGFNNNNNTNNNRFMFKQTSLNNRMPIHQQQHQQQQQQQQQQQYHQQQQPMFSNNNKMPHQHHILNNAVQLSSALVNLLNKSELTINLTKDEPRLVIYNNQQQQQNPMNKSSHQFNRQTSANSNQHQQQQTHFNHHSQFSNSHYPYIHYNNHINKQQNIPKFKMLKFAACNTSSPRDKNTAPYNTTQYIMYDYSKRMSSLKDIQLPNEQEQFSNDWNMAELMNLETNKNSSSIFNFNLNSSNLNKKKDLDNDDEELVETIADNPQQSIQLSSSKSIEILSPAENNEFKEHQQDREEEEIKNRDLLSSSF